MLELVSPDEANGGYIFSFTFHHTMNMKEGGEASGEAINHCSIFFPYNEDAFAAAWSTLVVFSTSFSTCVCLLVLVCSFY